MHLMTLERPKLHWFACGSSGAAVSIMAVVLGYPARAMAGDMDAVGYAILGIFIVAGIVVVVSILAILACKWIADPLWRAIARFLIVVVLYTPVPHGGLYNEIYTQPAFLAMLGDHSYWPHSGWLSHPFLLAYGGAVALGLPVVLLWMYVSSTYSRERQATQAMPSEPA